MSVAAPAMRDVSANQTVTARPIRPRVAVVTGASPSRFGGGWRRIWSGWRVTSALGVSILAMSPGFTTLQVRHPIYVEVEPLRVDPGASVEVRGGGWEPGSEVEFSLAGRDAEGALVGGNGYFARTVEVPNLEDGKYELVVRGTAEGEPYTHSLTLTISDDFMPGGVAGLILVGLVLAAVLAGVWLFVGRPRAYRGLRSSS